MSEIALEFPVLLETPLLIVLFGGLLLAGLAKGITGFALPPVAMGLLASVTTVEMALALVTLPIVVTNFWQALDGGRAREAFVRLWPLIATLGLGIACGAYLVVEIDHAPLFVILGLVAVGYVVLDLVKLPMTIPPRQEPYWHAAAGFAGGLLGGLTSSHGTLLAAYLHNLRLPKERFIAVSGVVWAAGSIYLLVAFSAVRVLTLDLAFWSALAVVPALLGMAAGRALRRRADPALFRRLVLLALFVAGLNLIRRGITG